MDLAQKIGSIRTGKNGDAEKPHKYALLLAIVDAYEANPMRDNEFFLDEEIESLFRRNFKKLSPYMPFVDSMIENPFFFLQSDGIWKLHIKDGMLDIYHDIVQNKASRFTKNRIKEVFSHASLEPEIHYQLQNAYERNRIRNAVTKIFEDSPLMNKETTEDIQPENDAVAKNIFNPFIEYLNSLQRSGGSNENALAESQACNAEFTSIHVSHPLAGKIYDMLTTPSGPHIILTGHAGDGKSTIALEVFKRLRNLPSEEPLDAPLRDREDIGAVSVIKDFSERSREKDEALMDELIEGSRHFLIVSNTGTLLDFVKQRAEQLHESPVRLESEVLTAISNEEGAANLTLKEQEFWVLNLSKIDNLNLARQIFDKMLAPERWVEYDTLNPGCPVHLNVRLLQENPLAVDRIFLAYRKMYEYGIRLTMRQFTEHLAYIITAGLSRKQLEEMPEDRAEHIYPQYLFFNTFFGDNGAQPEPYALEMKAVQEIRKQGFGSRPAPGWEHRLWLLSGEDSIRLGTELLEGLFEQLLAQGAKKNNEDIQKSRSAREQVRRMLYFLCSFDTEEGKKDNYISRYLNTPMLIKWKGWQTTGAQLSLSEKGNIEQQIYHVLQEHFSGVRIPEGVASTERRLYITLSRKRSEVRQSAQVVLAQLDWSSSVELDLEKAHDACGESRRDLLLRGKGTIHGLHLPLHLPFLDFVMMRHQGELGEVLQASYIERLDRFKAQVHERARQTNDHEILLVRLKTDHTFRRQLFAVKQNKLEVTHAS
jgi:hypothetical protein